METTKYKDIIIADNFITAEENELFVSLIEKPKCYETLSYWRFLGNESKVTPLSLNYYDEDMFYPAVEGVDGVTINNAYVDVKKRILKLLKGKYKVEHSGIEKFADYVPYMCDSEMPIKKVKLGIPSPVDNDHSNFLKYEGDWGLTTGGSRKYVARIFINHDFKGGSLTFPNQKIDVQPAKDRLVLYPCNRDYVYGIRNIDGGSFYLTFWFTKA